MRALVIAAVTMLMAFAATARQEPTPPATEAPTITADHAPPKMLADHLLTAEQDCAEFAKLALQGDPQSIEAFLSCVD